jgi:hypothetical protein
VKKITRTPSLFLTKLTTPFNYSLAALKPSTEDLMSDSLESGPLPSSPRGSGRVRARVMRNRMKESEGLRLRLQESEARLG